MFCAVASGMLTKKKLKEAFSVLDKSWVSSTVAFLCFYLTVREMYPVLNCHLTHNLPHANDD